MHSIHLGVRLRLARHHPHDLDAQRRDHRGGIDHVRHGACSRAELDPLSPTPYFAAQSHHRCSNHALRRARATRSTRSILTYLLHLIPPHSVQFPVLVIVAWMLDNHYIRIPGMGPAKRHVTMIGTSHFHPYEVRERSPPTRFRLCYRDAKQTLAATFK